MKKETKKRIQLVSVGLFLLYLILLIYFLFFAEEMGRAYTQREISYNLHLFREIRRFWIYREELGKAAFFLNIFGNVICFIPFGAIFPILYAKARNIGVIIVASMGFSCLVECIQLLSRVGSFDVDDILLNTIGGITGYVIFAICNWLRRKHYG